MKPTIVLVEDQKSVLALLERIIAKLAPDYDLVGVPDGPTALALFAQRPVALVMTDQSILTLDGLALTAAIKAVAPLCPVILMTGYPTSEIRQRAQAAGVDFFLLKPLGFEHLASIVRAALGR
jgi:DNA-binding NtrC family response regulator